MNLDFHSQSYSAEILRVNDDPSGVLKSISEQLVESGEEDALGSGPDGKPIRLLHGFWPSERAFHRTERVLVRENGDEITVPRVTRSNQYLYDVLVTQNGPHIVVAVPFHSLAEHVFPRLDRALRGVVYERIDIGQMVLDLGATGTLAVEGEAGREYRLWLSRCHLAYSDPENRSRSIRSATIAGDDLGQSPVYQFLVEPVLNRESTTWIVSPVLLGFGLSVGSVRKASATTDSHGNFKVYVSPSLRSVERMFLLIATVERMVDVIGVTPNVPILQSGSMRSVDES